MITIQEVVENELNKHPIHSKLLSEDMLNATSFARLIEPNLKKNLLKYAEKLIDFLFFADFEM